jgi:hypothetical protein
MPIADASKSVPKKPRRKPRPGTKRPRFVFGIALPRTDGRTWEARRFKHLVKNYVQMLGGPAALSEADRSLIRQAAGSQLTHEELQAARIGGADVSIDDVIRSASESRRAIALLEARKATKKPASPSLAEYLAESYSE